MLYALKQYKQLIDVVMGHLINHLSTQIDLYCNDYIDNILKQSTIICYIRYRQLYDCIIHTQIKLYCKTYITVNYQISIV